MWGLALAQEELGNQTQHKVRGELGRQVHQSQEMEVLVPLCMTEREAEEGESQEAFPPSEPWGPEAGT